MSPVAFINFSGGVDSTYYLWRWLKDHPQQVIKVHHCKLHKRRREVESKACENILAWFKSQGLENFQYVTSIMSKGTIRGKFLDVDWVGSIAGFACRDKSIKTVLLPYCYEETPIIREHLSQGKPLRSLGMENRTARFIKLMDINSRKILGFTADHVHKTKEDMIREMPQELFALTWFCRKPKDGKPCEDCFNCKRVTGAVKKISNT